MFRVSVLAFFAFEEGEGGGGLLLQSLAWCL